MIQADNDIAVANEGAFELMGAQIIGRPFFTALRQSSLVADIEMALETGAARTGSFATIAGHTNVTNDVHIRPSADQLVLTFIDISDAQDLDNFRRDFVANVSHELRTPLASVMGFIETLRGPAKGDAAAHDRPVISNSHSDQDDEFIHRLIAHYCAKGFRNNDVTEN